MKTLIKFLIVVALFGGGWGIVYLILHALH